MGKPKKKTPAELAKILAAVQEEVDEHLPDRLSAQYNRIINVLKAGGVDTEEPKVDEEEIDEDDFV